MLLSKNIFLGQQKYSDTLQPIQLKEVILIGKKAAVFEKQQKSLSVLDDYLLKSSTVNMVKRGAYAWEPYINNMATERTLVTIDGMRIFGACTDKMDPITSYVEITNLSEANILSGHDGSQYGTTIGGAIDLKRNKSSFGEDAWKSEIHTGFEANNNQKIGGASINFKNKKIYSDSDIMVRNADNYVAGGNQKVAFSQFNKSNFSNTFGIQLNQNKLLETSFIYDKATDVGYPALPMDVSLAEAFIGSAKYELIPIGSKIEKWETKIYFNSIKHVMDDSKRPNVAIHMDMPGWSQTFGYYSVINFRKGKHQFAINANSFYNKSYAEMTMYPNNPNENLMFMLTWPDVRTLYNGIYLEDIFKVSNNENLKFSASLGSHFNTVASEFGLQSLRIFHPTMSKSNHRFLKSFGTKYTKISKYFEYNIGVAFSERAPSVSEAYGFYLYNSFDGYDNIGNPNLNNEKALEGNAAITFKKEKFSVNLTSSYFKINDYIIAKTNPTLSPMTIGANGVRVYTAFEYATIFNTSLSVDFLLNDFITWNVQTSYARAKDNDGKSLPFISPLSYSSSLKYYKNNWSAEILVSGNDTQTHFNPEFGEDQTTSFVVLNLNTGYKFKFGSNHLSLKTGVENVFDRFYSTYSDWKNIPRMGRNFYVNVNYSI